MIRQKASLYKEMDWESWMKKLPKEFQELYAHEIKIVDDTLKSNDLMLDVGFGSGRLLKKVKLPKNAKIIGIDNDIAIFNTYFSKLKSIPNTALIYSDAKKCLFSPLHLT